ncbi:hypothetical protein [Leisingera sp. M658]|uniref:hypothetical protein n=1 Tax=Leisingera sp. M658 TaxID=2867015 RepID=UPI0021A35435|nr:hypothetical protein [Leisingera sp. M658]UWQ75848.1 hypothetical protein K3724_05175 [Leisingera sp. M658]
MFHAVKLTKQAAGLPTDKSGACNGTPLSQTTIDTVKATVPALAQHGREIVAEMYDRLLADPEIRTLLNQSHQNGASPSAQH